MNDWKFDSLLRATSLLQQTINIIILFIVFFSLALITCKAKYNESLYVRLHSWHSRLSLNQLQHFVRKRNKIICHSFSFNLFVCPFLHTLYISHSVTNWQFFSFLLFLLNIGSTFNLCFLWDWCTKMKILQFTIQILATVSCLLVIPDN